MSLSNLFGILQQYAGHTEGSTQAGNAEQDFQRVSQAAPQEHLAGGLAEAFRSGGSSSFPQMVSSLFSKSDGTQQAGILNHLMSALGPGASAGILGNLLGSSGNQTQIDPQQASQIPPEKVHELATEAQKANPSIVDQASNFYAQHPTLVQSLGAGALAMIMSHMSRNQR